MRIESFLLARTRSTIDRVDDALLLLLATRTRLALAAGACKNAAGLPMSDPRREAMVRGRSAWLAERVGVSRDTASALAGLAIGEARRAQGLRPDLGQGRPSPSARMIATAMDSPHASSTAHAAWLRWFPPPARWAPLLRHCPPGVQAHVLERAMSRVLDPARLGDRLDFLRGRRLGIEVIDLDLQWVVTFERGRLRATEGPAEASVRGTATDLLALAGRLEDADRLFFQRRLVLTGDTELGLTARNVLDALPWEEIPLGLRILLNRGARFAHRARDAHRDRPHA